MTDRASATDPVQQPVSPAAPRDEDSKAVSHPTSIAVWGVPSPVVVNHRFVAKVGVKCSAGCRLAGRPITVRNEAGADVGHGRLGETPEPGTAALHAAQVTLDAPVEEGIHAWTAAFDAAGPDSPPPHEVGPGHTNATATFGFRTVPPPDHRVTVTVCGCGTEAPLANAEVRVGAYRAATDVNGQALVEVPESSYDLYVRKAGYAPHTGSVEVFGAVTVRVAVVRAADADPDEEQVWM